MVTSYTAFLLVVVGLVLVPGPDTFVVLRSAVAAGRRSGLLTVTGVFVANALQGSASAFGLGLLIARSHTAFTVLRWVGVAYLILLGVQALRAARRGDYADVGAAGPRPRAGRALLAGFLSNITNPKVLVLYLSVLPQFLVPGAATFGDVLLLALTVAVVGGAWQAGLVAVVHRARGWFSRRRVRRAGDAVAGVALLGFGGALAAG